MSLKRALSRLDPDPEGEGVLRDVLALFGHHDKEWLAEEEIALKTGRLKFEVRPVLGVLVDSFVLEFDASAERYRYCRDAALDFEIDVFMRRVEHHQSHTATNVARFRERQGY